MPRGQVRGFTEHRGEITLRTEVETMTDLGSLTVEERRNLPLALVGLIFLHFYPCYCVDTICPNIV